MRILLTIHHDLDPDSGAPGTTYHLAQEYRSRGHEVEVVDFALVLPSWLPEQARMVAFPWAVAAWLVRYGRQRAFDVIDASTGDAWLFGTFRRAFPKGVRSALLVTRSHGLEHTMSDQCRAEAARGGERLSWMYPLYHGGYRLWEVAQSMRKADTILFLNAFDRQVTVDRLGVCLERTQVERNGISDALIGLPLPQPLARGNGGIAVIGSYVARKGVAYAAAALNAWLPRHPGWTVSFLGTGVGEADVLADYHASLHDRITVVPRYPNTELPRLLSDHHVHLFPTLSEGFGLALVEAMACGLAPVVSNVAGPIEIVRDGHDALVVPPASSAAIVEALNRLECDPTLLQKIRLEAHRTAQSYGWRDVAGERLAIYEHLQTSIHHTVNQ